MQHDDGAREQLDRDTAYSPGSERETRSRQRRPASSRAVEDPAVPDEKVKLVPGTGGPDDSGDVEVNPDDLHLDAEPGDGGAQSR